MYMEENYIRPRIVPGKNIATALRNEQTNVHEIYSLCFCRAPTFRLSPLSPYNPKKYAPIDDTALFNTM